MTRSRLAELEGQTTRFMGTFTRYGKDDFGEINKTMLKDVVDLDGNYICDHLWVDASRVRELNPNPGDIIIVEGYVSKYTKGWQRKRGDIRNPILQDYGVYNVKIINKIKKHNKDSVKFR